MIIGLPNKSPNWHQRMQVDDPVVSSETAPLAPCYFRQASIVDTAFLQDLLQMTAKHVGSADKCNEDLVFTNPQLRRYHTDWGRQKHDFGFVAVRQGDGKALGAAWVRQFTRQAPGFAYLGDDIPELTMAVLPQYRNQGIGSQLVARLITHAHKYRCAGLSVGVTPNNELVEFYERMGFEQVDTASKFMTLCHWFGNNAQRQQN